MYGALTVVLQLDHSYDANEMYGSNYGYRSGLNGSMVSHLNTNCTIRTYRFENSIVLDIGSNDATSLKSYKRKNLSALVLPSWRKFRPLFG